MGLSVGQLGELTAISRQHDISRQLQHLSLEKLALTRDMDKITEDYQKSLSAKTLKWGSGTDYVDLNYATLMRPNLANAKSPLLITDQSGRVVLDKKYKKYAEMLDSEGGEWGGEIRTKILSELTGIPEADIDNAESNYESAADAANNYNDLLDNLGEWEKKETSVGKTEYLTTDKIIKLLNDVGNSNFSSGTVVIHSASDFKAITDSIKNSIGKYFVDDDKYLNCKDKTAFEKACDATAEYYQAAYSDTSSYADQNREAAGLKKIDGLFGAYYSLDVSVLLNSIMTTYASQGGTSSKNNTTQEPTYAIRKTDSSEWQSWYEELKNRHEALDAAKTGYDSALNTANMSMTASQETQLKYYDLLFQAIADNGWVYDDQIEDSEYLNQMFQNNSYYVTSIIENKCEVEGRDKFEYDTDLASNYDNIFIVNDSDARDRGFVEYDKKKRMIQNKEQKIDTKMKDLEMEQNAIAKMIESYKETKNTNIENTFKIFA